MDGLIHNFHWKISYFEGLSSGDSGVVPLDGLADGLVRGFKGQEFINAGEQTELVANFEDVSHEPKVHGFADDVECFGVEGE